MPRSYAIATKMVWASTNKGVRDRIKHANGDELGVEIDANGLHAWTSVRANRYALKDDDEDTRNGIAHDESGEGSKADFELLTRGNAVVEEEDGERDGERRWVVEDFGGDLDFCYRYWMFDCD